MKLTNQIFLSFISIFIVGASGCKPVIDVTNYQEPKIAINPYSYKDVNNMSLSIIPSGYSNTQEAFLYRGGKLFKKRKIAHVAILVQHPEGNFLFDTGLGSEIEKQFKENMSFFNRLLFKFEKEATVVEALREHNFQPKNLDFAVLSHLHFDHASGIEDLPALPVWTTKEEYDHAVSENVGPAFFKQQYDSHAIHWNFINYKPVPYEIFNKSLDVFGDGRVVLVPLGGHTVGSTGMFVNLPSGKRYFFTGDATWALEGFERPSEKYPLARKKVDHKRESLKETIVKIHHLMQMKPEIIIVPSHDYKAQKNIAHFPEVER